MKGISMKSVSVIAVFNPQGDRMLLCRRTKAPYKGLLDFVGGKCEGGEDAVDCAYRELQEETGITREDIILGHVMDFVYHTTQWCVQVFAGRLMHEVTLVEEINPLLWVDMDQDFYDETLYAGEGYISHILSHMRMQLDGPST